MTSAGVLASALCRIAAAREAVALGPHRGSGHASSRAGGGIASGGLMECCASTRAVTDHRISAQTIFTLLYEHVIIV